jgi:CDP-glucose 4,6-dehydratase
VSNIFITGAMGFIGHELLNQIHNKKNQDKIVTLVRDIITDKHIPDNVNIIRGDLSDFGLLRRVIADYEIDTIYHMASQAIVRTCATDPLGSYTTNVMGTVNLLEAARVVGGVKSIVVSTSDKVYGHAPPPYTEDTPLMPKFTYEATKACQDIVCQNYFHQYDLPVKIVRCSNVYGPSDPNQSRLIPNTINRLLSGQAPEIYQDVLDNKREFVYISDVLSALNLINEKGLPGEAYCVGGVGAYSVGEIIQIIKSQIGSKVESVIKVRATTHKEIKEQWIDATKLYGLGWKPKISLEEGLSRCVLELTKKHLNKL